MSQWPSARYSSGVEPYGSATSLPGNSTLFSSKFYLLTKSSSAHAASFGGHETVIGSEKAHENREQQKEQKPWYKRRNFIISQIVMGIIGIIMIFVLLWPVVHAIAQHVLDVSHMIIESSIIESPSNDTFKVRNYLFHGDYRRFLTRPS
jgi:hypothetical protein